MHAAAAIDILAAAPLVSATSLGQALGIATNNATRLLDGFVLLGIVSEVTHRVEAAALWAEAPCTAGRSDRTATPAAAGTPARPADRRRASQMRSYEMGETGSTGPLPSPPPLKRREFDFTEIDRLLDLTDQAIHRVQHLLEAHYSRRASVRLTDSPPTPFGKAQ